ncbi:Aryl-alcohol oxidase [Rasamsonia emersonii CBS 393.64]|uniref:Aryl-alcohol oxidase n=1 Tax=Rasamsonia emersonii (strain ATCC 16479 / CBS 393.64 / IMI 116815) TaxID=1408163 RepID=A0A0F4Z705_RASE3|nr:Aryl-alcohol oxidase [Rasamsonia emersonii CBS 393.64]KKA25876.1 Aryl-alcohol oxidase [Rasamsonia emersonii CBS 393.64]
MRVLTALSLLSSLSAVLASSHHSHHSHFHRRSNDTTEYDYVIVGSGAGGGPLAARLALGGYKVLLIDAGDDEGNATQQIVPALQLQATEYEPMRWDFFVNHYPNLTRQEQDSKMTYRTPSGDLYVGANPPAGSEPLGILYPRAGTLGGCTAHNAMITVYPDDSDWQQIADITGDSSWNPDHMRTYFERLERNRYLPSSVVGHGYNGWLTTSLTSLGLVVEDQKLLSLIISACTAVGKTVLSALVSTVTGLAGVLLRDLNDPNRGTQTGPYQVPIAVTVPEARRNGPRDFIMSVVNAVNPDGSRKYHLDIQLETLVTKVRFDTSGSVPRAVGVDYLQGKSLYRADPRSTNVTGGIPGSVNAKREVILSGGTFNTPQLLKLSGVGPKEELERFNIPVVVNLPGVGTNMQDRYETTVVGESDTDFFITARCTFLREQPDPCLVQWQNNQVDHGTYATNGIAIAILQNSTTSTTATPDLFISGAPANFTGYFPGYSDIALKDAKHWAWIVLKAHSRDNAGTVTLRSADPRDTPIINFNYFDTGVTDGNADQLDLQAQYEGMQWARRAFKDLIPLDGTFTEVWPGPNVTTEEQMKDFIKREAWGHHACCTNPIGADDDPNAVLDSNFRVRGVDGLRVVDASVFPKIPGYYIALPIYMISEKASDVILAAANATNAS